MPSLQSFEPAPLKTLSMLDATLENSKKQLIQLRKTLAENPKELAKKERLFMIKECAKLETIGNLQVRLDAYREAQCGMNPGQRNKSAASSEQLGNHLRANGQFKFGRKWRAHHIVCSRHSSHVRARFLLFAYLGINDPHNGCWLPEKHKYATGTVHRHAVGHVYLHTSEYAEWIEGELRNAYTEAGLISKLMGIRLKLLDARKLPDVLTDKGKQDLHTHS